MLRFYLLCLTLLASFLPGAAWAAPSGRAFWDQYVDARNLLASAPDSAAARMNTLLAADPDDFLAHWLMGALVTRSSADSTRARELVARASASLNSAGLQVAAGTVYLGRDRIAEGRGAFERAAELYDRQGRKVDAARATLWKVVLRKNRIDRQEVDADVSAAEVRARATGDPRTVADALLMIAANYTGRDVKKDVGSRMEAIQLIDPLGPSYQLMEANRGISSALRQSGDIDGAEKHCRKALESARALGLHAEEGWCLAQQANLMGVRGDYRGYLDLQRQSLDIAKRYDTGENIAAAHVGMATVLARLGRSGEARREREAGVAILRGLGRGSEDELAAALDQLGSLEAITGDLEGSRARFEEAADIARRPGNRGRLPFVLLHLAQSHADADDISTALRVVDEGREAARETGHDRAEVLLAYLRGTLLQRAGRPDDAFAALREASTLADEVSGELRVLTTRMRAELLRDLGRAGEAMVLADSMVMYMRQRGDSVELARALRVTSVLHREAGRLSAATTAATASAAIARRFPQPILLADALTALGRAELAADNPREALGHLQEADMIRASVGWKLTVRGNRSALRAREDRRADDVALARAWIAASPPGSSAAADSAFRVFESARVAEVRELFGVGAPGLESRIDAGLFADLREIEGEITGAQSSILQEYTRPAAKRSPDLYAMETRHDSLRTRWNEVCLGVARAAPRDYGYAIGLLQGPAAGDVRAALSSGERVLAFMVGDEATLRFDFTHDALQVHEIPAGRAAIAEQVTQLHVVSGNADAWNARCKSLAELVLGGCEWGGDALKRIYVLPDAGLRELPFEALHPAGSPGGERRRLVELAEVVYAGSGRDLVPITAPASAGGSNPLLAVLGDAGATSIAVFDDALPARSAVAVTGGDTIIRAADIVRTPSAPDLVTLSACRMDGGASSSGEGLLGLTTALRLAGARRMLIPLRPADTAGTRTFMSEFHRRAGSGESEAGALRASKLQFASGDLPPAIWANFVLHAVRE